MQKQKRGQVTVFMIIGIILLFSAALVFYLKPSAIFAEKIPAEVQPISTYVESCIKQTAEPAITLIGLQGGYLNIPDKIKKDRFSYVEFAGIKVPYWYYKGEDRMPSKGYMENQLSDYIDNHLNECLNNLTDLKDQFNIEIKGEINTTTAIGDENVMVKVNYPINVRFGNSSVIIDKFSTEFKTGLGKAYDLSKEIMKKENDIKFLEKLTDGLVAASGLPYEGLIINCGDSSWSIENDIKPTIQNMVKYNFHFLRFGNMKKLSGIPDYLDKYYYSTRSRPPIQPLPKKEDYKLSYWINVPGKYSDLTVNTFYNPEFGMNVKVHPSTGDIVKPIELNLVAVGQCIKTFHHFYSVEYPLVFQSIYSKDPEKTYSFNFATPVIVENNKPSREINLYSVDKTLKTITSEDYCNSNAYDLSVYAKDEENGDYLNDVDLSYQCVKFMCDIGKTQYEEYDNIVVSDVPYLAAKIPYCINGWLIAKKQGYLDSVETVTSGPTMPGSTTIEMTPLKKLNYSFNSINLPLNGDEEFFVHLTNIDKQHTIDLIYPSEAEQYKNLNLLFGDYKYNLDIKVMRNDTLIGGYYLKDWSVERSELIGADEVKFNVFLTKDMNTADFTNYWANTIIPDSENNKPGIR